MKFKRRNRWMKLDNAAKIYPAARTRRWTNVFRVSITLKEEINPEVLQTALDKIRRRFPSICVKVKPGMFWYYIEETGFSPTVEEEGPHACMKMSFSDIKNCAFRVLYYKNRISAEFFHSLTDGNGALVFLKTLAATYIEIKHNIDIPHTDGVLDISTGAKKEELEDSFLKYSRKVKSGRRDTNAYILRGTHINENFTPLITGVIDVDEIKQKAKEHNITITSYLVSILCYVLQNIQEDKIVDIRKRKPIKILLPVNLRTFYPSKTLRNFVLYITPGINPQMGRYSFEEITKSIYHQMGYELTEKQMNARIVTNVNDELNPIVRIMPLFIKNTVMKIIYNISGERKACITISNLGNITVPEVMRQYIERFDFILSPQVMLPGNCSVISYNNKMYISFVRNIKETDMEREFFKFLVKAGIKVKIESNRR